MRALFVTGVASSSAASKLLFMLLFATAAAKRFDRRGSVGGGVKLLSSFASATIFAGVFNACDVTFPGEGFGETVITLLEREAFSLDSDF